MSKEVTIDLEEPIEGHGPPMTQVKLRKPKFNDVMEIGTPFLITRGVNGDTVLVEQEAKIKQYADLLVTQPVEPSLLSQIGLRDTQKIRDQIVGFFLEPAAGNGGSKTSPQT